MFKPKKRYERFLLRKGKQTFNSIQRMQNKFTLRAALGIYPFWHRLGCETFGYSKRMMEIKRG